MREVEVWVPIGLLIAPEQVWPETGPFVALLATVWLLIFAALPLFNADRRRAGDLVGGTLVIQAPRAVLERDVASKKVSRGSGERAGTGFTTEQLGHYGIYELQVLEDLLRRPGPKGVEARAAVCARIKRKIGWSDRRVNDDRFLHGFYAAQRAELERRMQFGERKERKTQSAKRTRRRRRR